MAQLTVSGRDTVYVWVGRDTGGQPDRAAVLVRRAGALLLGHPETGLVLTHDRDGRPVVRVAEVTGSVELAVSVSRTAGLVVVAASRAGAVGVDVERIRPLPALALARRWFPPTELAWLGDRPEAGRTVDFLRLWTAKEAVGKALGRGLRGGGLRRLMPPPGLPLRQVPGAEPLRVGHPRLGGGLVLAVAIRASTQVDVEVVQRPGHGVTAERSASVERTSLPVVVRGN
ncbi:4'-phosphopantetheinyl transferase superfamily protein [Micromonospora sp. NBC_00362]|uniref:4'-phosphopantetheinyl transferase family protein n=1 Tax=unclassified Micromonospora TaxID=2617518 RepID=UPI0022567261|nr:4'-phosphopantetheinyl transferase superfamily protein [Micromonospora sp. NBC_00362]MCX5116654.1 4'-phosphopantetheinyl transferase superfamily protein [Micromonospora sp. NBC_00362]WTI05094.1 4'-phosphopantetheinyl transferase superfamily protein [Micromonospora sp. NBC_00821]